MFVWVDDFYSPFESFQRWFKNGPFLHFRPLFQTNSINFVTNFLCFSPTKKAWEMTKSNWNRLEIKSKHAKLFYNNWEIILSWVRTWEFVKYLLTKVAQLAPNFGGFIYTFFLSSSFTFQSGKFASSSICN